MHFLKGAGGGGFLRSFYQTSFFLVLMKVSLIFIVVLNLGSSSFIRERSSIMSACLGGWGVWSEMLTLLTVGSGGLEKSGLRTEIKRNNH